MKSLPPPFPHRSGVSTTRAVLGIIAVLFLLVCALGLGIFLGLRNGSGEHALKNPPVPPAPPLTAVESGPKELAVNVFKEFRYEPRGFPMGIAAGQTQLPAFSPQTPANLKKAPAAAGEILYVILPLGNVPEEMISVAMVDRQQLYFDDNGNGDFSDDPVPCPKLSCNRTLLVAVRGANGAIEKRPYTIWFWFIESQGAPRFYSTCHYARDMQIGTETYRAVAFEQKGHNGLLHDAGLWIDLDRDGKLAKDEHFMDGQVITVAGQEHKLALKFP
ncbi:MAG TPA: hypothetical protein VGF13_09730 [Verrucomicrobiae bacterium]|jgi:hypothetical protein